MNVDIERFLKISVIFYSGGDRRYSLPIKRCDKNDMINIFGPDYLDNDVGNFCLP